jgi:hypothetical protein
MSTNTGPKEPSRPTIKRLFAVSGNRCAFPECDTPLVDPQSGSIVGEVCHVKGEKLGAARYDPNQSSEERHGFDNLILLCNFHHKVIDDNPATYSFERLLSIKKDHENRRAGNDQMDEHAADAFASAASTYFLHHGSVIHATNQTGGQVAHSITNNYYETPIHETPPIGSGRRQVQRDPRLSEQALELLRQAASGDGSILVIKADAGLAILVHDRQVNEMGNPRSEALYRQIIENLYSAGLISKTESVGHVVVYKLTHSAFELIDAVK